MLHIVPFAAPQLPLVSKRDLEAAIEAAHAAARLGHHGPAHGFRFRGGPDILLADPDAATWVGGVALVADLGTAHGISVCLRLLGLIALCASASWVRRFFSFGADGLDVHPRLLRHAALSRLTQSGGFDETALRNVLEHEA